jgi:hypothetical protein
MCLTGVAAYSLFGKIAEGFDGSNKGEQEEAMVGPCLPSACSTTGALV